MKKTRSLIALVLCICTGNALQAQQEEKTVKPLPAALTKAPAADKPSATYTAKPIVSDAAPATPSPSAAPENTAQKEELKGTAIDAGSKKGQEVKSYDRPKPSTIEPEKKTEPAAKPKPVALIAPES